MVTMVDHKTTGQEDSKMVVNGTTNGSSTGKIVPQDKQLLNLFWELSENNSEKRLKACEKIVKIVTDKQEAHSDGFCDELKYSVQRLVAGLASNRKSSRLGFSTVLARLLQGNPEFETDQVISLMEEKLKVNSKTENKDLYFGQVFCLLTLLKSNRICGEGCDKVLRLSVQKCLKMGEDKSYLKSITFHTIKLIVEKVTTDQFKGSVWPSLCSVFNKGWTNATADTVETLEMCHKLHPDVCNREFLQVKKWIPSKAKTTNLIASHSFKHLGRIIAETTQHHPVVSQYALDTIKFVATSTSLNLGKFWEVALKPSLLTSSPERKYLAIKLAVHSLQFAAVEEIEAIWSKDILANIQYASTDKNALHLYCKRELGRDMNTVLADVDADVQFALLMQLFNGPAGIHMPIINVAVNSLKYPALIKYIAWLKKFFLTGHAESTEIKDSKLEVSRRWCITQLAKLVRTSGLPRYENWIGGLVEFLTFHSLFKFAHGKKDQTIEGLGTNKGMEVELSEQTTEILRRCLFNLISCLNSLPSLPADVESATTSTEQSEVNRARASQGVMTTGRFWVHHLVTFADGAINNDRVELRAEWSEDTCTSWKACMNEVNTMTTIVDSKKGKWLEARALQLLLLNVALQLFGDADHVTPDDETLESCVSVLDDVRTIIKKRFAKPSNKKKKKKTAAEEAAVEDEPDWVEVIVEILLNMLSNGSHGTRVIVDHVFKMMMSHMTPASMKLIVDVINMNEDGTSPDDEEDEEMEVDGEENDESDDDDDDDEDESDNDEDMEEDAENDEEFRNKIKEALGEAAAPSDNEEDDDEDDDDDETEDKPDENDDMDDEAMMKIDHLIAAVFKERKNALSSKKSKLGEKMELIHFKLRCLDLLETFVSRHHGDCPLVFDLILPLVSLIARASKNSEETTLAEKATLLLRIKVCKAKTFPRDLDNDVIEKLHDIMDKLVEISHTNGAVFIARVTSQCCMFILRCLIGNQRGDDDVTGACDVTRVEKLYVDRLDDFMMKRQSRVQCCIFEELIHCRPQVATFLACPLLKYVVQSELSYRKIQACQLLTSLLCFPHTSPLSITADDVITRVGEVLSQVGDEEEKQLKAKYHGQLLKLMDTAIHKLKLPTPASDDDVRADVVTSLKNNLTVGYVDRSQELKNSTWNVLVLLGETRNQADKKSKEQKNQEKKEKREQKKNNKKAKKEKHKKRKEAAQAAAAAAEAKENEE